jgi:D-amino peptidase
LNKLKVYIVCDLEGVAGIVDFKKQCMENGEYYQQAIRVATNELNASIEGLIAGGASEIYAWPGHGDFPGGIDFEYLHPECNLIMHAGDEGPAMIDDSFDAMVLHGFHAMAGTPGVLSHSFIPMIKNIWFDETRIGEIAMNIYSFSEHNVPCIMVTGDSAAVEEARNLIPDIEGVTVKWGLKEKEKLGALSVRQALSLSPAQACKRIRKASEAALRKAQDFKPLKLKKPFTLKVEYTQAKYAEAKTQIPGVTRLNNLTISKECQELSDFIL